MLSKFSIYEEKQNLKKEDNLKPDEKKNASCKRFVLCDLSTRVNRERAASLKCSSLYNIFFNCNTLPIDILKQS